MVDVNVVERLSVGSLPTGLDLEVMQMKRVAQFRADMARELLPIAHLNGDAMVINACVRVRQGWLLGHRVNASDLAIVQAFHDASREG